MHAGIDRLRAVEAVSVVERLPCAATSLVGMWCWVFWHAEGAWFAGEITEFEPEGSGDVTGEATPHFVKYAGEPADSHWHLGPDAARRELILFCEGELEVVQKRTKTVQKRTLAAQRKSEREKITADTRCARAGVTLPADNAAVSAALELARHAEVQSLWPQSADAALTWLRAAAADALALRYCSTELGKYFEKVCWCLVSSSCAVILSAAVTNLICAHRLSFLFLAVLGWSSAGRLGSAGGFLFFLAAIRVVAELEAADC